METWKDTCKQIIDEMEGAKSGAIVCFVEQNGMMKTKSLYIGNIHPDSAIRLINNVWNKSMEQANKGVLPIVRLSDVVVAEALKGA